MSNSSLTGGVLLPQLPYPLDDDSLDQLFQNLVVAITGLDGTLVRPRWQPVVPKRPSSDVNWCAISVMSSVPNDGPSITYDPLGDVGIYTRHETLEVVATFYGPNSKQYAAMLRDGLAVPQNCDVLRANAMAYVSTGPIRPTPELINQTWFKRQDINFTVRRKITRNYAITYLAIAEIIVEDDTNVYQEFSVPNGVSPL